MLGVCRRWNYRTIVAGTNILGSLHRGLDPEDGAAVGGAKWREMAGDKWI